MMKKAPKPIKPIIRLVLKIDKPITKWLLARVIENSIPQHIPNADGTIVNVISVSVQKVDFD